MNDLARRAVLSVLAGAVVAMTVLAVGVRLVDQAADASGVDRALGLFDRARDRQGGVGPAGELVVERLDQRRQAVRREVSSDLLVGGGVVWAVGSASAFAVASLERRKRNRDGESDRPNSAVEP